MKAILCTLLILTRVASAQASESEKTYDLSWNATPGKRYYETRVDTSHTVTRDAADGPAVIDSSDVTETEKSYTVEPGSKKDRWNISVRLERLARSVKAPAGEFSYDSSKPETIKDRDEPGLKPVGQSWSGEVHTTGQVQLGKIPEKLKGGLTRLTLQNHLATCLYQNFREKAVPVGTTWDYSSESPPWDDSSGSAELKGVSIEIKGKYRFKSVQQRNGVQCAEIACDDMKLAVKETGDREDFLKLELLEGKFAGTIWIDLEHHIVAESVFETTFRTKLTNTAQKIELFTESTSRATRKVTKIEPVQ